MESKYTLITPKDIAFSDAVETGLVGIDGDDYNQSDVKAFDAFWEKMEDDIFPGIRRTALTDYVLAKAEAEHQYMKSAMWWMVPLGLGIAALAIGLLSLWIAGTR